jgi:hypothetical protein
MINNIIKIIIISGTLVLSSCAFNTTKISFNPIPYEMKVPQELASKLSVEPMTGDWANQIATASVVGALTMHYTAEDNTKHILQEFITLQKKDLMLQKIPMNHLCSGKKFHVKTDLY